MKLYPGPKDNDFYTQGSPSKLSSNKESKVVILMCTTRLDGDHRALLQGKIVFNSKSPSYFLSLHATKKNKLPQKALNCLKES